MAENFHKEHRDRVRKEFLARGFDTDIPKHKILEMLLFYSIPRKDTNELAHMLLNRFGSLSGVFEADKDELMKVEGVGENTVALLKLMLPVMRKYLDEKQKGSASADNMEEVCDFLTNKYIGITKEVFSIASFDSRGKLCGFDFLSLGDVVSVGISSRMVIETAIKRNAAGIILAHNHPGGNALPSKEDLDVTYMIGQALKHIGIKLIDHIIICDDDYVTLRQSRDYSHYFK